MPPNRQREDPDVSLIPSWCEELRAARLARGWSEDDLADQIQNWEYRHGAGRHLGVSRSYVSEWETGKRGVSRDYAIRIEGVTGIPRDHFIDHRSSRGRVIRLHVACHEYGTVQGGFLPRSWDHPVASDGTTRRSTLADLTAIRLLQVVGLGGSRWRSGRLT